MPKRSTPAAPRHDGRGPKAKTARRLRHPEMVSESSPTSARPLDAEMPALRHGVQQAGRQLQDLLARLRSLDAVVDETEKVVAEEQARLRRAREASEPAPAEPPRSAVVQPPGESDPSPRLGIVPEPGPDGSMIETVCRARDSGRARLVRYLNDAWGVESGAVDWLQNLADSAPAELRDDLQQRRQIAHQQRQALADRIKRLGATPRGGATLASRLRRWVGSFVHRPRDQVDRWLQEVALGFALAHFEIGLYHAIERLANAHGDHETAQLAARHAAHDQAMADLFWKWIGRLTRGNEPRG